MAYNTAGLGRGGDTKIRNVAGETSHVNPYEAYLIDTYEGAGEDAVMEMGSGTINPATGMREYQTGTEPKSWMSKVGGFLASPGFGAAMWGIDLALGLFGRSKAKKAAGAARDQSLAQLVSEKEMIGKERDLQEEQVGQTFTSGIEELTAKTTASSRMIAGMEPAANMKSKMAFVGDNKYRSDVATRNAWEQYWRSNKSIVDTKALNEKQVALSYDRNINQANERHQSRLTQIESMV